MKFETRQEDDKVVLKLGTAQEVVFANDAPLEIVIGGVAALVEKVSGIPVFPMIYAVMNAQKDG